VGSSSTEETITNLHIGKICVGFGNATINDMSFDKPSKDPMDSAGKSFILPVSSKHVMGGIFFVTGNQERRKMLLKSCCTTRSFLDIF
jgi:hypothetical protein